MVLVERPETAWEVEVMPLWSTTVEPKSEEVETCTRYEVAPEAAFQLRVKEVAWLMAPFEGEDSVGTEGSGGTVVKFQTVDHELVPPALVAFARQ